MTSANTLPTSDYESAYYLQAVTTIQQAVGNTATRQETVIIDGVEYDGIVSYAI